MGPIQEAETLGGGPVLGGNAEAKGQLCLPPSESKRTLSSYIKKSMNLQNPLTLDMTLEARACHFLEGVCTWVGAGLVFQLGKLTPMKCGIPFFPQPASHKMSKEQAA